MNPLHILLVTQSLGVGGAERFIVDLINHSDPARFRFSVVVFSPPLTMQAEITGRDVLVRVVPKRGKVSRQFIHDLEKVMREIKPDVVHTNLFAADIWAGLAAKNCGIPVISTEHNVNYDYGFLRTMIKRSCRSVATEKVACSEAVKKYMVKTYAMASWTITVIPYGVDTERLANVVAPKFQMPLQLAIIGRLVKQKGHSVALRALATLKQFSWQLSIVGGGPLEQALRRATGSLGLEDRVTFESFTNDVPKLLEKIDCVVMPSLFEGLGIVAREAMAAGRVVLCSAVDGLVESVTDNQTGLLVPPNNVSALAEKLRQCFEANVPLVALGQCARQYALEHFTLRQMIAAYAAVYEKMARL